MKKISCVAAASMLLLSFTALANDPADNGALDPTFGSGGEVRIVPTAQFPSSHSLDAVAVATQSTGKIIIAGNDDNGACFVARLNADGSIDGTFSNGNGQNPGFAGYGSCTSDDVAVRSDDRILLLAHGTSPVGLNAVLLAQFTADGSADPSWVSNPPYTGVYIVPPSGDSIVPKALVIDTVDPYTLGSAYFAGQYVHASGERDVFYGGVSADGHTTITATYDASKGSTHNASATSIAQQPSTGNIIIGGYATSAANDLDCLVLSAIVLTNPNFKEAYLYGSFGTGGATVVPFNLGGTNNDTCNALTMVQPGDYIAIGGSADTTFTAGANTYPDQRAAVALLDGTGHVVKWINAQTSQSFNAQDFFTWSGAGANGGLSTITRLIPYTYGRPVNGEVPSLITVGYGYHALEIPFTGIDMGLERLTMPGLNNTFFPDPTLNAQKPVLQDFGSHVNAGGGTAFVSADQAHSAIFTNGKLLVVGQATDPNGGNDIAVARFAAFDGIFHTAFESVPAF